MDETHNNPSPANDAQNDFENLLNNTNQEVESSVNFKNRIDLSELQQGITLIKDEMSKVIVGQKSMMDMLIASILANGHSLIEGVPGVAKTISAKLLAK